MDHEEMLKEIRKQVVVLSMRREDGHLELILYWQGKMHVLYSVRQASVFMDRRGDEIASITGDDQVPVKIITAILALTDLPALRQEMQPRLDIDSAVLELSFALTALTFGQGSVMNIIYPPEMATQE